MLKYFFRQPELLSRWQAPQHPWCCFRWESTPVRLPNRLLCVYRHLQQLQQSGQPLQYGTSVPYSLSCHSSLSESVSSSRFPQLFLVYQKECHLPPVLNLLAVCYLHPTGTALVLNPQNFWYTRSNPTSFSSDKSAGWYRFQKVRFRLVRSLQSFLCCQSVYKWVLQSAFHPQNTDTYMLYPEKFPMQRYPLHCDKFCW